MNSLSLQDIGLRAAQWKAIEKKAKYVGATTPEYLRQLIERDLLADKSFSEIVSPVREDVRKSGLTEDRLGQIVQRARRSSRNRRSHKVR